MPQPQPQAGLVPNDLMAAGLKVFPCNIKKEPIVPKAGTSWKDLPPEVQQWPAPLIGIQIPENCLVIDVDRYKGVTPEDIDTLLGCKLPWSEALIQTTTRGGEHYAFRVDFDVRQGSNLHKVAGFDTRVGGKGYICTGASYTSLGFGVFRLAQPASLPRLPDAARAALEHVKATSPPTAGALPADMNDVLDALKHIDPNCGRDTWLDVGMALHTDMPENPALWDQWSSGQLAGIETPVNYVQEHVYDQWASFKPDGGITIATLFHEAKQAGWKPPPSVDTALAFPATAGADPDKITLAAEPPGERFHMIKAGNRELLPLNWAIEGVIEQQATSVMFGEPKAGKTFTALDMCLSIAAGIPYHGRVVEQMPVAYIAGEGQRSLDRRILAWCLAHNQNADDLPFFYSSRATALLDKTRVEILINAMQKQCPDAGLLVVDTLARNLGGGENDNDDINKMFDVLDNDITPQFPQLTKLIIAHPGHQNKDRPRGGAAILGNCDALMRLAKKDGLVTLRCVFMKESENFDPMAFNLTLFGGDDGSLVPIRPTSPLQKVAADTQVYPDASMRERAARTGVPRSSVQRIMAGSEPAEK